MTVTILKYSPKSLSTPNNQGFRRFQLRGMEKVTIEVVWLSLPHNMLKQAAVEQKRKGAVLQ
ncbi:hypothetical protein P4H66_17625 [Paenibacillus dokdonensis]|uniref:Transposase DDE domain-containing protein n=1 Tax=Paenibacillus dokdonensis TaxID=2567944 RepID=A0ABU6GPI2_9BACL|nr:hypothetical protein [Paenibacillus dokdonensis]MEC0241641.1 hypothetical protein [Paenibacillus dokdonensis]